MVSSNNATRSGLKSGPSKNATAGRWRGSLRLPGPCRNPRLSVGLWKGDGGEERWYIGVWAEGARWPVDAQRQARAWKVTQGSKGSPEFPSGVDPRDQVESALR